jgi:hypothetical protein
VTAEIAVAARRALLAEIDALREKLVPLTLSETMVTSRLLDANLISGIVDGRSEAA